MTYYGEPQTSTRVGMGSLTLTRSKVHRIPLVASAEATTVDRGNPKCEHCVVNFHLIYKLVINKDKTIIII